MAIAVLLSVGTVVFVWGIHKGIPGGTPYVRHLCALIAVSIFVLVSLAAVVSWYRAKSKQQSAASSQKATS